MTTPIPWQTRSLRSTIFADHTGLDAEAAWEEHFQSPPDEVKRRPSENTLALNGSISKGMAAVQFSPGRIDLQHIAQPHGSMERDTLGKFSVVCRPFGEVFFNWLSILPLEKLTRIAFGAQVFFDVADAPNAIKRLRPFLSSVKLDDDSIRDFVFQINRRRTSIVDPEIGINRLAKWSSVEEQIISINQTQNFQRTVMSVQLQLDINTIPVENAILPKITREFMDELVENAAKIAIEGDRA